MVEAIDDTPASRKGLLPGDRITKIDGETTRNKTLQDSLRRLMGKPGERVTLTIVRQLNGKTKQFNVTMIREASRPTTSSSTRQSQGTSSDYVAVPTKEVRPVQWKGNKIVSRVLPYSDFISLFIRLPIAHAAATEQGVKVAVIQLAHTDKISSMTKQVAPGVEVKEHALESNKYENTELGKIIRKAGCRIVVIPDVDSWAEQLVIKSVRRLLADKILVIIPSDFSEDKEKIRTVNVLHSMGALTVGRVNRGSLVMQRTGQGRIAFNRHIRKIQTEVFSTVGLQPYNISTNPVATVTGVAALVLEKWPRLMSVQVRDKIIAGARRVWQATAIESGKLNERIHIDPITTEYTPNNEDEIFWFRVLDAAASLEVDTDVPRFLNMLNCHKAWEITKGEGTIVVVSDHGFHLKHPDLVDSIKATKHFGPRSFKHPYQNFHGTSMSRILLSIAPDAKIIPVLYSADSIRDSEELAKNIAKSFRYAAKQKADVISASWAGLFNKNEELLSALRYAVDGGVVASWFNYPESYPGLLRSRFTYSWWETERSIGFADRFLTDSPGFHPVEIEAGLSGTAPQAAGIAALVKSVNAELTPRQVEKLILENSTLIGSEILTPNVCRAVLAAKQLEGPPASSGAGYPVDYSK